MVVIFWHRKWARKLLFGTVFLILLLHTGFAGRFLSYYLESRYPPVIDCRKAEPYDAIVVLAGGSIPAKGLIAFPMVAGITFHRLDEAWRLYRLNPKPIVFSGSNPTPRTPAENQNLIACSFLTEWGVPSDHVISEDNSRDTYESAVELSKLLKKKGWRRYLLVTSALHMPRSMLLFRTLAPEPIPAPADFLPAQDLVDLMQMGTCSPVEAVLKEYLGWIYYSFCIRATPRRK